MSVAPKATRTVTSPASRACSGASERRGTCVSLVPTQAPCGAAHAPWRGRAPGAGARTWRPASRALPRQIRTASRQQTTSAAWRPCPPPAHSAPPTSAPAAGPRARPRRPPSRARLRARQRVRKRCGSGGAFLAHPEPPPPQPRARARRQAAPPPRARRRRARRAAAARRHGGVRRGTERTAAAREATGRDAAGAHQRSAASAQPRRRRRQQRRQGQTRSARLARCGCAAARLRCGGRRAPGQRRARRRRQRAGGQHSSRRGSTVPTSLSGLRRSFLLRVIVWAKGATARLDLLSIVNE